MKRERAKTYGNKEEDLNLLYILYSWKCDSPNFVMQEKQDGFPHPAGWDNNYMNAQKLTKLLLKLLWMHKEFSRQQDPNELFCQIFL